MLFSNFFAASFLSGFLPHPSYISACTFVNIENTRGKPEFNLVKPQLMFCLIFMTEEINKHFFKQFCLPPAGVFTQ